MFLYVDKIEVNGIEDRIGADTIYDSKLKEMQAHITITGTNIYFNQEQLDEFVAILQQLDLTVGGSQIMPKETEANLDELRIAVDEALSKLAYHLPNGTEQAIIDHCIDCIDGLRVEQLKPV